MGKLALLAFAVLLPTLVGGAILAAVRGCRRLGALRRGRPQPAEPVDRIAARLRRLRAELEATENQPGGDPVDGLGRERPGLPEPALPELTQPTVAAHGGQDRAPDQGREQHGEHQQRELAHVVKCRPGGRAHAR